MPVAYVGLGSNVGDREAYLEQAIAAMSCLGPVRRSGWYETEPEQMPGAAKFLNAVVSLDTTDSPRRLLDALLGIEQHLGRGQSDRKGPRTIDLDLLLYGTDTVSEPGLEVPHPRMHLRAFVLVPLCEMAAGARHPGLGRTAAELLAALDTSGVVPYHSSQ